MSITVTFYQFAKRENSTAQPTQSTVNTTVDVLLKESCTDEQPVLILNSTDIDNYLPYNYCYIPFFSRFYFINHREVNTGKRLYIYCNEDYLGSFKQILLQESGFIKYSSAGSYNIPETRMATTKGYTVATATADFPMAVGGNNYFLSVTGINGVETYNLFRNDIKDLFSNLQWDTLSVGDASDEKGALKNLANLLGSGFEQMFTQGAVFNNIRSAYVLPFPPDEEILGASKNIYAGYYDTGIEGQPLVESIFSQAVAIGIPWLYDDWRRCAPYTDVYLYLPFFGTITLDTNTINASAYLTVKYSVCYSNGDVSYSVETDQNRIVATGKCNVRAEYGIGSSNMGVGAGFNSAFNEAIPLLNQIPVVGEAIGSGLNAVVGTMQSFGKGASKEGGLGGFSDAGLELRLKCWTVTKQFADTQSNFALVYGLPEMRVDSFAGKTGFLQTADFYFSYSAATESERNKISAMCNNGIYIN